jgi:hypothetical protein
VDLTNKHIAIGVGLATGMLAWLGMRAIAQGATMPTNSNPLEPFRGNAAGDAGGHRTPTGQRVITKQLPLYPNDRCTSVRSLLATIQQAGLTGRPAVLFLAHVCRETAYGRRVYNYNYGNIKAPASGAPWFRLSDREPYAAYPSAVEGMRKCITKIDLQRYTTAKAKLLAGDKSWYSDLGVAGYYEYRDPTTGRYVAHTWATVVLPGEGQDDYNQFLARVEACLAPR